MLESMTAQQFDEWVAYYSLEPFGAEGIKPVIAAAGSAICHAFGAETMPWDILGIDEPTKEVTPNEAATFFRGAG